MLKVFLGFLVSVVVLLSSASVGSPTYAVSASILITHIQAGAIGAATQEFIVVYNNSSEAVDISGWCLTNKNDVVITCFNGPIGQRIYLPPYARATAVSSSLAMTLPVGTITSIYVPASQSSGSIAGSNDTVSLIDTMGNIIDRKAWTTPLSAGMQFERLGTGTPILYQDTDSTADWAVTLSAMVLADETHIDTTIVDVCPNIEGIQPLLPFGQEINAAGECVEQKIVQLDVTEILPNAIGSDVGYEFIELYNPNDVAVNLADYKLYVGLFYENTYDFPDGSFIEPYSYLSFFNSDIPFTLPNSSGQLLLALQNGRVVSEVPQYSNPKDGQSWAVIDGVWQYTAYPTPGLANAMTPDPVTVAKVTVKVVAKAGAEPTVHSCAANQYRSPETNRCRLMNSDTVAVTPCKDGQYRSEETNRCRNVVAPTAPAACKEGQERNPDTNRCRTVTKMPNANYGVLGAETKSGGNWYVLATVGGVVLLALGYAVWEWHDELGKFFRKVSARVRWFARVRK